MLKIHTRSQWLWDGRKCQLKTEFTLPFTNHVKINWPAEAALGTLLLSSAAARGEEELLHHLCVIICHSKAQTSMIQWMMAEIHLAASQGSGNVQAGSLSDCHDVLRPPPQRSVHLDICQRSYRTGTKQKRMVSARFHSKPGEVCLWCGNKWTHHQCFGLLQMWLQHHFKSKTANKSTCRLWNQKVRDSDPTVKSDASFSSYSWHAVDLQSNTKIRLLIRSLRVLCETKEHKCTHQKH